MHTNSTYWTSSLGPDCEKEPGGNISMRHDVYFPASFVPTAWKTCISAGVCPFAPLAFGAHSFDPAKSQCSPS